MIVTYRNRPTAAEAPARVTSSADVARAFDFLRDVPHEEVWALLLSADNRPVGIYLVGKGTTSEASVSTRMFCPSRIRTRTFARVPLTIPAIALVVRAVLIVAKPRRIDRARRCCAVRARRDRHLIGTWVIG